MANLTFRGLGSDNKGFGRETAPELRVISNKFSSTKWTNRVRVVVAIVNYCEGEISRCKNIMKAELEK